MSTIAQIEDAMLAALREKLSGVEVDTLPGPPEDAARRTLRTPAVWVVYQRRDFNAPEFFEDKTPEAEHFFIVLIISRNLRSRKEGARGAYELLDLVHQALDGLAYQDDEFWPVNEQIFAIEAGLFVYKITYKISLKEEQS